LSSTAGQIEARPALIVKLTAYVRPAEATRPAPWLTVALLTLLGVALRILSVRGFSAAEATTGYVVRLPFHGLTEALAHSNAAPLNVVLLWGAAHSIGSSEFDLRLLPALIGAATIPMLYLAGRALYGEGAGLVAAAIGAVGALDVWYGQDAGSGALVIFLTTVTIWALARAVRTNRTELWLLWAAAAIGLIWTQWSATLVVTVEVIAVALACGRPIDGTGADEDVAAARRRGRRALGATALIIAGGAAALPLIRWQAAHATIAGLGPDASAGGHATVTTASTAGVLVELVWGFHTGSTITDIVAFWPLAIAAMLLVLGRARHAAHALLAAVVAIPLIAAAASTAVTGHNSLQVGDLLEVVPALYLLIAGVATLLPRSRVAGRITAVAAVVILGAGLAFQQYNTSNPQLYGYRAAFANVSSAATPGSVVVYSSPALERVVGYFEPGLRRMPLPTAASRAPARAHLFLVASSAASVAGHGSTAAAAEQLRQGRRIIAVFRAPQVVVWELS
jgi:mannosyltransferase